MAAILLFLLILWGTPLAAWMMYPLENRFSMVKTFPEHVDGIVILGGGLDPVVSQHSGHPAGTHSLARLLEAVILSRHYPDAKLLYSGGSGSVLAPDQREAPVAKDILIRMGVAADRILIDANSRNSWENAVESRKLVGDDVREQKWLLVTSAFHMPRAMECFHRIGWPVMAYPTDFMLTPQDLWVPWFDIRKSLFVLQTTLREWGGQILYSLVMW